jgi:hypothetical protein
MSDAFSERQKGFERKYQLDEEQQFRANARRDKLFGQWIAAKLGMSGADTDKYAQEVVASNFELPGDDDMLGKVRKDLKARNITVDDAELTRKLRELHAEASKQIAAEKK